ncbi:hypothetical protein N0V82_001958 [Gnomoniopsis sp. IMI 355080]|nr:hypothetical protein N0V82_001958 [Gnomoniopsis sp. IMI 355080]
MDTLRLLRARLDELLNAQPSVVRELAQLILQVPQIIDSPFYGLVLRTPQAFISLIRSQASLAGLDLPFENTHLNSNITAQVNELRSFLHIHLRRANLYDDPRYALILRLPEGFSLPGESQNLEFADAFLIAANALGHSLPNSSDNLVAFARAFLSAIGRSSPGLAQLIRSGETPALAVAWFVISLYTGSPRTCNYHTVVLGSQVPILASITHTLASAMANGTLGGLGDVARLFRRAPGVEAGGSLPLPAGLEIFALQLGVWSQLTICEQQITIVLGKRICRDNEMLVHKICVLQPAFFAYCRQIASGSFDASAFQTPDEVDLTVELMNFIMSIPELQKVIEGVRYLHHLGSPPSPPETRPVDVLGWNAGLFAQWQERFGHDDDEDIDIMTERMLSHQLLDMAAATNHLDVEVLGTHELPVEAAEENSFPGFTGPEESENTDDHEQDFDDVCLFCVTRLCDPGQSGGEAVHILSCCGKRVGAICLEAYVSGSSSCPFCSQAL